MGSLKKIFKEIMTLELEKYKYSLIREKIDELTYISLVKVDDKYKNEIQVMEDDFDNMLVEINKVKDVKIVVPKYKPKKKIFFGRLFLILILMLVLGIIYDIEIIILLAIIMMIMLGLAWLFNMEDKEDYIQGNLEYENALKLYLYQYNRLLELRNNLGNKKFADLYLKYENKLKDYILFRNKYSLLKTIEQKIVFNIDKNIVKIDKKIKEIYEDNNIDKEYHNYLAISLFYEYINNKRCNELKELYKVYKQEYSFIVNDTDGVIDKVNNNKLKEDIDKKELEKINTLLKDLELYIVDNSYEKDSVNKILLELEKYVLIDEKLFSIKEKVKKEKKKVKKEDNIVVSIKKASKIDVKKSKKEAKEVMKKVNKTLELIKRNNGGTSNDVRKTRIIKDILDKNKDSIIEGLRYYGINDDGMMVVSSDTRTYVINMLYVPENYYSNIKFPHKLVNRMIMDIENKLDVYTKVKINMTKVNRLFDNGEAYKLRRGDKTFVIDINILKDTIDLLGDSLDCYVFSEEEPIYMCNKIGEKAIIMSNLRK